MTERRSFIASLIAAFFGLPSLFQRELTPRTFPITRVGSGDVEWRGGQVIGTALDDTSEDWRNTVLLHPHG